MALSSGMKAIIGVAVVAVILGGSAYVIYGSMPEVKFNDSNDGSASGDGKYFSGATVTLIATPNEGYQFVGWYENSVLYSDKATFTFTINSSHTFTPKFELKTYVIAVALNYSSAGTVSSGGSVQHGKTVNLNATVNSGYSFEGWYDGSTLLSKNVNYYHTAKKTTTITAKYSIIHDASFTTTQSSAFAPITLTATSTYNVEITSRSWYFEDAISGKSFLTSSNSSGGTYGSIKTAVNNGMALKITQTITYSDGQTATSTSTVIVDELVNKSFSWKYHEDDWTTIFREFFNMNLKNNKTAGFTWDLKFSTYYSYATKTIARGYDSSVVPQYITSTDPYIKELANFFNKQTSGWTHLQRANYVLKFVQSIPYEYDQSNYGRTEYYAFPMETLWKQSGDCEDHAFLFGAIMKAMGYDVVMVSVPQHLLAAVSLPDGVGSYTTLNGVKYYFCEATATNAANTTYNWANVGYIDPSFKVLAVYRV